MALAVLCELRHTVQRYTLHYRNNKIAFQSTQTCCWLPWRWPWADDLDDLHPMTFILDIDLDIEVQRNTEK